LRKITTTSFPELAEFGNLTSHEDLHRFSIENPEKFWSILARSRLSWENDFHTGMDCEFQTGRFNWFLGGKLNISYNCVDRWAAVDPDRTALVWEKDTPGDVEKVSYAQLKDQVSRIANTLLQAGVGKGDVVALYIPVSPIAVASMLAAARIGAVHTVVFAGFSSEALAARIIDSKAKVLITGDEAVRGGKRIGLKATVDAALVNCPTIKTVFVARRTGATVNMVQGRDEWMEESMSSCSADCPPVAVDSEDPLFLLYTSGSTGKPKGVSHSSAGFLLYAMVTMKHAFDYNQRMEEPVCCLSLLLSFRIQVGIGRRLKD